MILISLVFSSCEKILIVIPLFVTKEKLTREDQKRGAKMENENANIISEHYPNNNHIESIQWIMRENSSFIKKYRFDQNYYSVCVVPQRNLIILGDDKGTIDFYENLNDRCIKSIKAHSNRVSLIVYFDELNLLLSASIDGSIVSWGTQSLSPVSKTLSQGNQMVLSIIISRYHDKIAVCTANGYIILYDMQLNEIFKEKLAESLTDMFLNYEYNFAIIASKNKIWYFNLNIGKIIHNFDTEYTIDRIVPLNEKFYYVISSNSNMIIKKHYFGNLEERVIQAILPQGIIAVKENINYNFMTILSTNKFGVLIPVLNDSLFIQFINDISLLNPFNYLYYSEYHQICIVLKLTQELLIWKFDKNFKVLMEKLKLMKYKNQITESVLSYENIQPYLIKIPGIQKQIPHKEIDTNNSNNIQNLEYNQNKLLNLNYINSLFVPNEKSLLSTRKTINQHLKSNDTINEQHEIANNRINIPFKIEMDEISRPYWVVKCSFPVKFDIFPDNPCLFLLATNKTLAKYIRQSISNSYEVALETTVSHISYDIIKKKIVLISRISKKIFYYDPNSLSKTESFDISFDESNRIYYSTGGALYIVDQKGAIEKKDIQTDSTIARHNFKIQVKKISKIPHSDRFIVVNHDQQVYLLNFMEKKSIKLYESLSIISGINISPNNELFITYSGDQIIVFSLIENTQVRQINIGSMTVKGAYFTNYTNYIIIIDDRNQYYYYNLAEGVFIFTGSLPSRFCNSMFFAQSREIISMTSFNGNFTIWDPHLLLNNSKAQTVAKMNLETTINMIKNTIDKFLKYSLEKNYEDALEKYANQIAYHYNNYSEIVTSVISNSIRSLMMTIFDENSGLEQGFKDILIYSYKGLFLLIQRLTIYDLVPLLSKLTKVDSFLIKALATISLFFTIFKMPDQAFFIQGMNETNPKCRILTIEIIEYFKDPSLFYIVDQSIFDTDSEIKRAAIKAAISLKMDQYSLIISRGLNIENEKLKRIMLEYISEFGTTVDCEFIIQTFIQDIVDDKDIELYPYIFQKIEKRLPKFRINLELAGKQNPDIRIREIFSRMLHSLK